MSWPDWYLTAECRGIGNPDIFFPTLTNRLAVKEAVDLCRTCPSRVACAQLALDEHLQGIWGGLTDHQRAMIRRNQAAPRTCEFETCEDPLPLDATKTSKYCEYHRSYYHRQVAS